MPARSRRMWLGATASAGDSFSVGISAFDQRTGGSWARSLGTPIASPGQSPVLVGWGRGVVSLPDQGGVAEGSPLENRPVPPPSSPPPPPPPPSRPSALIRRPLPARPFRPLQSRQPCRPLFT